jgi:integrase
MFAGLRPEKEGTLIDWDDITEESITVDETIAKDGETRIIEPLTPNLIEWIKVLRERGIEPLTNLKRKWNKVKSVIGRPWPHDALRHTYASYHYAMFKDAGLTAKNLGHPNPTLLRKDYNNAVTEKEAKKFWAITP